MEFGKTWWGKCWLDSLNDIDYSNRLPRGKSYARNDMVTKIGVNDNIINAKVKGRRPTPYKVTIIIPPFFEKETSIIMENLLKRPMLISKLLNRELDPEILTIAEESGIKVFPAKWTDLKMSCTCPDWAVPCKHLAATIYMFSREIDNDPFLVFEMHKLDLLNELKKRNIDLQEEKSSEIPKFSGLFTNNGIKKTCNYDDAYIRIDLSSLSPCTDSLVKILPETPPFYSEGDFREVYHSMVKKTAKKAMDFIVKNRPIFEEKPTDAILKYRSSVKIITDLSRNWTVSGEDHNIVDPEDLLSALFKINRDFTDDYEPSVAFMRTLAFYALHLIANGAITPMIYKASDNKYIIHWFDASIDHSVRKISDILKERIFPSLLYTKKQTRLKTRIKEVTAHPKIILSFFITELIKIMSPDLSINIFSRLFFKGESCEFKGVGEQALAGAIKVWLDRHHIHSELYKPVLHFKEHRNDTFNLEISLQQMGHQFMPIPVREIILNDKFSNTRFRILKTISLLSPFIPGLDDHINSNAERPVNYDMGQLGIFLMELLPVIRLLDIQVIMPKSLEHIFRPKPTIRVKMKRPANETACIDLADLLHFDWQVALGHDIVTEKEFKKITAKAKRLLRFKDSFIYVDPDDLSRIKKHFESARPLTPMELLQAAIAEEFEGSPVLLTNDLKAKIKEIVSWDILNIPASIDAKLRPYQTRGYSWMYHNSRVGFGSIIADDMGLGKTIQVITLLQRFKDEGRLHNKNQALIVVPAGLMINWLQELDKFAPGLGAEIYHGQTRDISDPQVEIIITSYGVVRSDAAKLKKKDWLILIIDEAQKIKNYQTAQCKAVKSIPAKFRIAMSGTPVENRLSEFWSIMDFVNHNYLGSISMFRDKYIIPIQKYNDEGVLHRFKKISAPFLMRRLKTDKSIISDLPDKIEINQYARLSKKQASLYEATVSNALKEIEKVDTSNEKSLFKRQGMVLKMITALKQICNHPANYLKDGDIGVEDSGKTLMLLEILDIIMESREKALIFTQFREMGDILMHIYEQKYNEKPLFYHGGCSIKQRQEMVEAFQNKRAERVFILSLRAAGTGLNLTAANHVIHYDLWWNPAVESQATDRAYRIGQRKNVEVHRFITKNTFEEKINDIIEKKRYLAEMTVATGENWIGTLSNKELHDIFINK